jgi:hypothetical protein
VTGVTTGVLFASRCALALPRESMCVTYCNQAIAQVCAFPSPVLPSVSDIATFSLKFRVLSIPFTSEGFGCNRKISAKGMLRQPPTDNTTKLRPFIDLPHWQT